MTATTSKIPAARFGSNTFSAFEIFLALARRLAAFEEFDGSSAPLSARRAQTVRPLRNFRRPNQFSFYVL